MGRQIEFDGLVYCDWRINVRNCVEEEFFFGVLAFGTVLFTLAFLIQAFVLFFRIYILHESLRTGPNMSLSIVFCVFSMSGLLLFFGKNPVATAIFWALAFPFCILSYACYAYFLTMTFPVDRTYTRWIPKPIIFSKIVIFFGIELVTIFVFLLGFSEHWNSIGDLKTSNTLFVAALVFFLVNLIIFLPYYLYCSIIVLKMMRKREFEVSEPVRLALFKAKQNFWGMLTTGILLWIPFLSMSIDNQFFKNLPLSKACCILVNINSVFAFFLSLVYLVTDIKKKIFKNKRQTTASSELRGSSLVETSSFSRTNPTESTN